MKFSFNKKGIELAIGTIVVIAIAVLVVLVLVGYFLGTFGKSGQTLAELGEKGGEGVSGLNLSQKCLGGAQCSVVEDKGTCEQARGCYWGFG